MADASTVRVPTTNGSRYLQQLCKHWSHNLEVEFDAQQGRVVFPRDARGADWPGDAVVTTLAELGDGAGRGDRLCALRQRGRDQRR